MKKRIRGLVVCLTSAWVGIGIVQAQGRGGTSWLTTSGDAQRTSWVKTDPKISKESVAKRDFQFLWRAKLDNQARQLNSLTQPLLLPNIISYKGFKALAFVGGSSDNVYAIDYDLNRIFWKAHLSSASSTQSGSLTCPGGLTAITRLTTLASPAAGRSGAGVQAGRGGRGGAPAGGGGFGSNVGNGVYVVSSGGMAHTLNPQTGEDLTPPVKFLPPNAKVVGAIVVDNVFYAATTDNCGNVPNGVWAVDLGDEAKRATVWETKGSGVAGTAGPAFGSNGTLYVATSDAAATSSIYSNAVVALDPKSLNPKDWFTTGKTPFTSSPVVFEYKGKDLVVAANKDGRLYVLDSTSIGGSDHRTSLYSTPQYTSGIADFTPGALATWEDADGTRWVLAASGGPTPASTQFPLRNGDVTNGSIVAFKVVEQNGALEPAWMSRDMVSPVTPLIMNGVIFALSSGEFRTIDSRMTASQRAQRSKPAVLYALDAATGKELWNSGNTIASFVHAIGPSGSDSQVYVVTYDGTLYAFGIPLEH